VAYIHITKSPGMDRSAYDRVRAHLGEDRIEGQLSHIVGFSEGSLHTVDVWASREHADRFAAERLFPAFAATGVRPAADQVVIAFDAEQ
jgi:hypothetical protein